MNFRRVYAIFIRQLFLIRHNFTRLVNIFVWITVDIILWGFITRYLDSVTAVGFSFVPVLLGAVVLWDFLIRIQQGVMLAFFEDMWQRNFFNFFASPLTIPEYVTGLVITSIITSFAGLVVMLGLALLLFGFNIFVLGGSLILFLLILFLFGLTLGIFAAGVVLRFGPAAEWFVWPIPFIISPLAGVFYPTTALPDFLQNFASLVPPAYAFNGLRQILQTGQIPGFELLVGIGLGLVYLFFAYLFFVRIYKYVIRSGLISRFTAENTSN